MRDPRQHAESLEPRDGVIDIVVQFGDGVVILSARILVGRNQGANPLLPQADDLLRQGIA